MSDDRFDFKNYSHPILNIIVIYAGQATILISFEKAYKV